jgi:Arc/MetJ-type ribon-helix-helix transcriptional regulator
MEQMTIKVPGKTIELLTQYAEAQHDGNRSEAARELLVKGLEYDERVSDLETERDRLQRELRARNSRESDVEEIVEYVERERSIQERREERRNAPAWRRAKWWLLGRSAAD